jgi:hypothetical protein
MAIQFILLTPIDINPWIKTTGFKWTQHPKFHQRKFGNLRHGQKAAFSRNMLKDTHSLPSGRAKFW